MEIDKIIKLAEIGYKEALKDFHYPPISEPEIIHDPQKPSGFWIDTEKWMVHLNVAEMPSFLKNPEDVKLFFKLMSRHEIGHYIISPTDTFTSIKMVLAARKVVRLPHFDNIISNIVSDIIDDTKRVDIFGCYPILLDTLVLIDLKNKGRLDIDKNSFTYVSLVVLIGVKERIWNKKINIKECKKIFKEHSLKPQEGFFSNNKLNLLKYFNLEVNEELNEDINKIVKIIEKKGLDNVNEMPKKTEKIAKILKKYITEKEVNKTLIETLSALMKGDPERIIIDPQDGQDDEYRRTLIERLSRETKHPGELVRATKIINEKMQKGGKTGGYGEGRITKLDALRQWYRTHSERLAKIIIKAKIPKGNIPEYPTKWNISDPVEELDVHTTLSSMPLIIPGLNTRKWKKTTIYGDETGINVPDLLIVIDSSGSMVGIPTNPNIRTESPYHLALLGSFAALHLAWRKGAYMSVINFSDKPIKCDWTRNVQKAENVLLKYIGGGTVFPTKTFKEMLKRHEALRGNTPVIALIITDAGIANWAKTEETILQILRNNGFVAIIYINTEPSSTQFSKIIKEGARIYNVKNIKDLSKIIIETVKDKY